MIMYRPGTRLISRAILKLAAMLLLQDHLKVQQKLWLPVGNMQRLTGSIGFATATTGLMNVGDMKLQRTESKEYEAAATSA